MVTPLHAAVLVAAATAFLCAGLVIAGLARVDPSPPMHHHHRPPELIGKPLMGAAKALRPSPAPAGPREAARSLRGDSISPAPRKP